MTYDEARKAVLEEMAKQGKDPKEYGEKKVNKAIHTLMALENANGPQEEVAKG